MIWPQDKKQFLLSEGLHLVARPSPTPGVQQMPCYVQGKVWFDSKNKSYRNTEEGQLAPF